MNKKLESLLRGLTILGYVCVGMVLVISSALLVMFATGYFNPKYDDFVGFKFASTDALIIDENGGNIKIKLVGKNAEVKLDEEGNTILDEYGYPEYVDNTEPTEVKLIIRNEDQTINNTIIEVPETVSLGDYFEISAKLATDGFNVGGICYIYAESVDEVYRVQAPLEVKVDVPVDEVVIKATNPSLSTNNDFDLETQNFVYDDKVQFEVEISPLRARYVFGTEEEKKIQYYSTNTSQIEVNSTTGLAKVTYMEQIWSDEELVEPAVNAVIGVNVNKTWEDSSEKISNTNELRIFPLQLKEIDVNNEAFNTGQMEALKLGGDILKVSVEDTGEEDILNLGVFLQPSIYNPVNNSNPLYSLLLSESFKIKCVSNLEDAGEAFSVEKKMLYYEELDKNVYYWEIKAIRTPKLNEELALQISIDGYESKNISSKLEIEVVTPTTFSFVDSNNQAISKLSLSMEKEGDVILESDAIDNGINYTYTEEYGFSTFSKFVFFLTDASQNLNVTNSKIIDVADTKQINLINENGKYFINPLGAGEVEIVAYVVKTNEEGKPVDAFGNVILDGQATGVCMYFNEDNAKEYEYIAYDKYDDSLLRVDVIEKIIGFDVYTDEEFTNKVGTNRLLMGTQNVNKIALYAKPNSPLSLPANYSEYRSWYASIGFAERNGEQNFKIPDIVDIEFVTITEGEYQRYIKFEIFAHNACESYVSLNVLYNSDTELNATTLINFKAVDVPVGSILIDSANNSISHGSTYNNLKYWNLVYDISEDYLSYWANENEDEVVINKFYRLKWTDQGSTILMPSTIYSPVDSIWENGVEYQVDKLFPSKTNSGQVFYKLGMNQTFVVKNGNDEDVTYNVEALLNKAYDANESDKVLVENCLSVVKNNLFIEANNAKDYISTISVRGDFIPGTAERSSYQTLQFKKPLENSDERLVMVYWALSDNETRDEAVNPDMVILEVSWPELSFVEIVANDSESAYDNQVIEGKEYYSIVLGGTRTFDRMNLGTVTSGEKTFDCSFGIEKDAELGVEFGEQDFTILLNSNALAETFNLKIIRNVYFVTSVHWNDSLWNMAVEDSKNVDITVAGPENRFYTEIGTYNHDISAYFNNSWIVSNVFDIDFAKYEEPEGEGLSS